MSRSLGGRLVTSRSPMRIEPSLTSSSPASIRSEVDLPQPDGPTRTRNSPSPISRSSLSTAGRSEPGKSRVALSKVTVAMTMTPFTGRYVPDDPSGGWSSAQADRDAVTAPRSSMRDVRPVRRPACDPIVTASPVAGTLRKRLHRVDPGTRARSSAAPGPACGAREGAVRMGSTNARRGAAAFAAVLGTSLVLAACGGSSGGGGGRRPAARPGPTRPSARRSSRS